MILNKVSLGSKSWFSYELSRFWPMLPFIPPEKHQKAKKTLAVIWCFRGGGYKMELLARNGFGFNTINKKKNEKMY